MLHRCPYDKYVHPFLFIINILCIMWVKLIRNLERDLERNLERDLELKLEKKLTIPHSTAQPPIRCLMRNCPLAMIAFL